MIHKTAIIDSKAKIFSNVKIGPYSVIGPNVEIGENSILHSHVNISGNTVIGKDNKIYPFASIGNDPQDLKFNGEQTKLIIGIKNTIREYVTINPGTIGGGRARGRYHRRLLFRPRRCPAPQQALPLFQRNSLPPHRTDT